MTIPDRDAVAEGLTRSFSAALFILYTGGFKDPKIILGCCVVGSGLFAYQGQSNGERKEVCNNPWSCFKKIDQNSTRNLITEHVLCLASSYLRVQLSMLLMLLWDKIHPAKLRLRQYPLSVACWTLNLYAPGIHAHPVVLGMKIVFIMPSTMFCWSYFSVTRDTMQILIFIGPHMKSFSQMWVLNLLNLLLNLR